MRRHLGHRERVRAFTHDATEFPDVRGHSVSDPGHVHGITSGPYGGASYESITWGGGSGPQSFPFVPQSIAIYWVHVAKGGGAAHNNVQPAMVVNFITLAG